MNSMKWIAFATLVSSATAFAPLPQQTTSISSPTSLQAFEDALGAQPPIGFYDPLGLVADGDQAKFDRLRYVEIKHGRIAMLAVVGYLTTFAGWRIGGAIDLSGKLFADIPSGFAAFKEIPAGGLCQLVFFIGLLETNIMKDVTGTNEFPGESGVHALGQL